MLARSCLKSFKLCFYSMWIENFQMYKPDLEKAEEPEIKLPTFAGHSKKHESYRKTSTSVLFTMLKPLTVWITTSYGKFLKTTLPASWETCMKVKKQQLEPDMEAWAGSNLGKEYIKAVYCHPAYLTSMQSTLCEMLGWMNHSWNQDCWEKYQQPQICRWFHFNGRSKEELKRLLMKVK